MRHQRSSRVAAFAAAVGLNLVLIGPVLAQNAAPAETVKGGTAVPSGAAIDKGVPPAKHAGDEGGKPAAAGSASSSGAVNADQPSSSSQ